MAARGGSGGSVSKAKVLEVAKKAMHEHGFCYEIKDILAELGIEWTQDSYNVSFTIPEADLLAIDKNFATVFNEGRYNGEWRFVTNAIVEALQKEHYNSDTSLENFNITVTRVAK